MTGNKTDFELLIEKTMYSLHDRPPVGAVPTVTNAPVVSLVNRIIEDALAQNASDIHLEPVGNAIRIRMRIDGMLQELHPQLPQKLLPLISGRIKIISKINTVESRLPQDGRITYPYKGRNIDIRVSTLPIINGEKFVLRLLDVSHNLRSISELDYSAENEQLFRSWCHKPYGLILNVGPVNSGKTTTLYAALNELDSPSRNIITIEDPVEYYLPGINQIQVNEKIHLSFAKGLRAILRQDPDVVMLGEIRDEETAEIAIRAALTGHLLFTTLHTSDAAGAVFRLLDMGVAPYLLSASLIGITAQRLVRRICPYCAEKYKVSPDSNEYAFLSAAGYKASELWHAAGCEHCNHSGYLGRIALQELLPLTRVLRDAIIKKLDRSSFEALSLKEGLKPLLSDGIEKAISGKTTLSEVRRVLYGDFSSNI